jgi:hypothetical protein
VAGLGTRVELPDSIEIASGSHVTGLAAGAELMDAELVD